MNEKRCKTEKIARLRKQIDDYFEACDAGNACDGKKISKPYTLSGLLFALGLSKAEFEKMLTKRGYAEVLCRAVARIEAFIEENALTGMLSANACCNSLKYNFGWGEKPTAESGEKSIKIILDGELVRLAE